MRLLLDECIPKRLKRELLGHEVKTVQDMGWAGIKNGAVSAESSGLKIRIPEYQSPRTAEG